MRGRNRRRCSRRKVSGTYGTTSLRPDASSCGSQVTSELGYEDCYMGAAVVKWNHACFGV
ncbi:hypothetical protein E2C01_046962 [Portunus trituberculatus]|uniref:Uncharacterized protein n=1 Tax=Portunus trituberculatus TaxID=210409 RepID=A0A5B7G7I9_PORTR|nr:hypothetical protein [Portunus trituberculatus]